MERWFELSLNALKFRPERSVHWWELVALHAGFLCRGTHITAFHGPGCEAVKAPSSLSWASALAFSPFSSVSLPPFNFWLFPGLTPAFPLHKPLDDLMTWPPTSFLISVFLSHLPSVLQLHCYVCVCIVVFWPLLECVKFLPSSPLLPLPRMLPPPLCPANNSLSGPGPHVLPQTQPPWSSVLINLCLLISLIEPFLFLCTILTLCTHTCIYFLSLYLDQRAKNYSKLFIMTCVDYESKMIFTL